ncbi:DUF2382 domain-containing protein [Anabaena cylindrica FACHB-243]|uniref:PRC-barrel domain protein n=1 Tax=Anabaena cylindrica (strain ATCC 27899 / PCC 7122) TaxID=272123 RepID=K9ZE52_ANACC|nr:MULTISPECIES: DUF2382 domain-containing protein [Anabaena]AFZ56640.1 hypothetical protein Anacy_1068 [Anabaena cylindrica PCC 7122]MBD2416188.1 DUF2382 domain-containing protein [Anabaena cylindrica FACHB-243]MBY5284383.1 DUF2382 domain-containing protein [Anabaena sp. CCAP 1446/1C]MCM2408670.1 DUF2382 domain-containing protein [Anabaena sp. CCAP 1446/1C]QDW65464.1 akinete marker protein [Anabaena sp. CCAP 1446/1C]
MVLYKLEDFDPQYRDTFEGNDIKGLGVYTDRTDEKIGTVHDALVDEEGNFRYLVIDLGFWIFGKKVLLPIGRSRIDYNTKRVYAIGLTREQAENLPEFNERLTTDYDYEEQVRGVYRNPQHRTSTVESPTPLESPTPVESFTGVGTTPARTTPTYNRDTYRYEQEPDLFDLNEQNNQNLKLYQERLITSKHRRKMGDVTVGKHVETETARVSVPVERERVVVERVTPEDAGRTVASGEASFREGEIARVEIYEETPEIRKEAFVREEVRVKKVVEQDTVETQATVRREELDVNAPNLPIEER